MRIAAVLLASLALVAASQVPATPVASMFHPTGPMPSYEVATIKKADPVAGSSMSGPSGAMMMTRSIAQRGQTLKSYILSAYGVSSISQSQIVGGPAWIGTDAYVIQGKPPDELRDAMQKMTPKEQGDQNRMMQQSLLMDRFKLKAHFEVREMPIYELVPGKGGLKIKEVPAPASFTPGGTPPAPPVPGQPLRPGMMMMRSIGGVTTLNLSATTVSAFINVLRLNADIGGKPIVDKTGFSGNFDVVDLSWAGISATGSDADAPSLFTAVEERLGMKLTATKGAVEVIVIDSIERPSEN